MARLAAGVEGAAERIRQRSFEVQCVARGFHKP